MTIDPALLLQNWLSPAFPVGAFAYSHGLEFAVHAGHVKDRETCRTWIADLIVCGSWRNDAILCGCAWQAASESDAAALAAVTEMALALAPSRERHLEAVQQGNAFMAAVRQSFPHDALNQPVKRGVDTPYPVAIGQCAAVHGIARRAMLAAFGLGFAQALVSAALRLSIIGHTDGQHIIAALMPDISDTVEAVAGATLDDLSSATLLSDLCSLQHETQYTRFFRS